MRSMRSIASECGVSRGIPDVWAAAGLLGPLTITPNGSFADDAEVAQIVAGPVIRDLDDLRELDADAAEVLSETRAIVARCLPEAPRPENPADVLGVHADAIAAGNDAGWRRYWQLKGHTVAAIRDTIQEYGGQPMIVTVKGLVAVTTKITDLTHLPGGWEFQLAPAGNWAEAFLDARMPTPRGGPWVWWP